MVIVITGVTRGLGRALAEECIAAGHTVVGCGRSGEGVIDLRFAHAAPHDFSVVDVTDFFAGDTPAISGVTAAERTQWGVRRFDAARSWISGIRAFPMNVEVRHVQTFDAASAPGSDRAAATVSVEMRQSILLLPKKPMRPRYADDRAGFFTVQRSRKRTQCTSRLRCLRRR